jgi:hypothetical protein
MLQLPCDSPLHHASNEESQGSSNRPAPTQKESHCVALVWGLTLKLILPPFHFTVPISGRLIPHQ